MRYQAITYAKELAPQRLHVLDVAKAAKVGKLLGAMCGELYAAGCFISHSKRGTLSFGSSQILRLPPCYDEAWNLQSC